MPKIPYFPEATELSVHPDKVISGEYQIEEGTLVVGEITSTGLLDFDFPKHRVPVYISYWFVKKHGQLHGEVISRVRYLDIVVGSNNIYWCSLRDDYEHTMASLVHGE